MGEHFVRLNLLADLLYLHNSILDNITVVFFSEFCPYVHIDSILKIPYTGFISDLSIVIETFPLAEIWVDLQISLFEEIKTFLSQSCLFTGWNSPLISSLILS